MKRTRPSPSSLLAVVGAVVGVPAEIALAAIGQPERRARRSRSRSRSSLIGVIVVALAVPVRRVDAGQRRARRSTRSTRRACVVLAKASASAARCSPGVGARRRSSYLLTRSVAGAQARSALAFVDARRRAASLLAGGLVAEYMCTVPPRRRRRRRRTKPRRAE